MEKKKISRSEAALIKRANSEGEGGAVFYKNGKVVADTRPKNGGKSGKKK